MAKEYQEVKINAVTLHARVCARWYERMLGYMFVPPREKPDAIVFVLPKKSRAGVHMCFVWFPLDVYWLDENGVVIERRLFLRPYRFAKPKVAARYILEVPPEKHVRLSVGERCLIPFLRNSR